jgi:hypothetical protein
MAKISVTELAFMTAKTLKEGTDERLAPPTVVAE